MDSKMSQKNPVQPLNVQYVSKEESNCPLLPRMIEICKIIQNDMNCTNCRFLVSASFGKRIIINAAFESVKKLQREDFIELIDYNPLSNTLLLLGVKKPLKETAVHWIVHHAKKEIQLIIQIKNMQNLNRIKQIIPYIKIDNQQSPLEKAKKWLRALQKNEIFLSNDNLIITASSVKIIKQNIKTIEMELKQT
jgi:hypothetical protein